MKVTVQVVTIDAHGQESIRELACIEREELTAESLGLSVADSKALLQSLQEVVVEWGYPLKAGQFDVGHVR